jgi:hypothetical protein
MVVAASCCGDVFLNVKLVRLEAKKNGAKYREILDGKSAPERSGPPTEAKVHILTGGSIAREYQPSCMLLWLYVLYTSPQQQ